MNFVIPCMILEYHPEGGDPLAITIEGVRYVPEHSKLSPCKGCRHLSVLLDRLDQQYPSTEDLLFERRVRSTWGTLAIERSDLTIEEVRDVLRRGPDLTIEEIRNVLGKRPRCRTQYWSLDPTIEEVKDVLREPKE